jgi:hypothetical protein
MTVAVSPEMVSEIVEKARAAAQAAAAKYFEERLGGEDRYACGFAWVDIYGIKGNTKLGKALAANGFRKSYTGSMQMWNPSGLPVQNIDCKEAGAEAAAEVLTRYGFTAYSGSRLD